VLQIERTIPREILVCVQISPSTITRILGTVADGLLGEMSLDRRDTGGKLSLAGLDPLRPTVLKTGAASVTITAADAIASAILWRQRGGKEQDIHIDLRKAYVYQSPWQDVLGITR
jgi:hypothetical protein